MEKIFNVVFLVGFGMVAVAQCIAYNAMVARLRARHPEVRSVSLSWVHPAGFNFRLYQGEYHTDPKAMRLWRIARVLRLPTLALMPFAVVIIAHLMN